MRDYTGETEAAALENQIKSDLRAVWSDLILPDLIKGKSFEDFFGVHFDWLPHYHFKRQLWKEKAHSLKKRLFIDGEVL